MKRHVDTRPGSAGRRPAGGASTARQLTYNALDSAVLERALDRSGAGRS